MVGGGVGWIWDLGGDGVGMVGDREWGEVGQGGGCGVVFTLTISGVGLYDAVPDDLTGVVHLGGGVELHGLDHIIAHHADFQREHRHVGLVPLPSVCLSVSSSSYSGSLGFVYAASVTIHFYNRNYIDRFIFMFMLIQKIVGA